ncbi:MAG: hypothetical protein AAGD32_12435 [Planctomycetota bacterium]
MKSARSHHRVCLAAATLGGITVTFSANATLTHYVPFDAGYPVGSNIGGTGGSDLGFGANTWFDNNPGNAIVSGNLTAPAGLPVAGNHAATAGDFDLAFYTMDQDNGGDNGVVGEDNLGAGVHWLSFIGRATDGADFGGLSFTKFFGPEILYIGKVGGAGSNEWGFDQGAAGGQTVAGSDATLDTFIVVRLTIGAGANDDTAEMFINPSLGSIAPMVADLTYSFNEDVNDNRAMDEIRLGSGGGSFAVDEIRIGTEFADVALPEPAAAGLAFAGLALLGRARRC